MSARAAWMHGLCRSLFRFHLWIKKLPTPLLIGSFLWQMIRSIMITHIDTFKHLFRNEWFNFQFFLVCEKENQFKWILHVLFSIHLTQGASYINTLFCFPGLEESFTSNGFYPFYEHLKPQKSEVILFFFWLSRVPSLLIVLALECLAEMFWQKSDMLAVLLLLSQLKRCRRFNKGLE